MITITIPQSEEYDPVRNEFIYHKEYKVVLEHSLVSLHKWEQQYKKPFLSKEEKTPEEVLDYLKCMTISQNIPDEAYLRIPYYEQQRINAYIDDPMTATTFSKDQTKPSREVVTAELLYYFMTALGIPYECRKWHLNSLLTLIKVCGIKNSPPQKMSRRDVMAQNRALNAARRKQTGTKG